MPIELQCCCIPRQFIFVELTSPLSPCGFLFTLSREPTIIKFMEACDPAQCGLRAGLRFNWLRYLTEKSSQERTPKRGEANIDSERRGVYLLGLATLLP